jgi:CPA1 family monovalent cation:H+ antiporter
LLDAIKDDDTLAAQAAAQGIRRGHRAEHQTRRRSTGRRGARWAAAAPAIEVARQRAFDLRREDVIGDDAYRVLVQELDWAELSAGGGRLD